MVRRRAHRQRAAWLALFALGLQLALSFGHIHRDILLGLGAAPGRHETQLTADRSAIPGSPASPSPHDPTDEACSICASMSLAGSLVLPDAAQIAAPAIVVRAPLPIGVRFVVGARHLLFHTRAPPVI